MECHALAQPNGPFGGRAVWAYLLSQHHLRLGGGVQLEERLVDLIGTRGVEVREPQVRVKGVG